LKIWFCRICFLEKIDATLISLAIRYPISQENGNIERDYLG
jgi:hypothetical protein